MQLGWFVGVDWGSQTHQACVTDAAGDVVAERAFEHGGQGRRWCADSARWASSGRHVDHRDRRRVMISM